jgi:lysine 2,3-aminomutase
MILMMTENDILYQPRDFNSIDLWKHITSEQWNDPLWQKTNSIRTIDQLKNVIKINNHQEAEIRRTVETLKREGKEPMRITPYYASLIQEDPFNPIFLSQRSKKRIDPIFWQSVLTPANLLFPDAGVEAAMREGTRSFGAAYQRYPNRVALFVAENTNCASYCVPCQRSKSLDSTISVGMNEIKKGLFYIGYNRNINEVLVTGGDALMISNQTLKYILEELSKIDNVRSIRTATRVPVVMPMAITEELLNLIKVSANKFTRGLEKYVYFMTHINHFHEITFDLSNAIKKIRDYGFTVRNQTVLLNHVNDNFRTLAETCRRMFWIGVHPYYLLQCHKEKGIGHFITPVQVGKIYIKHLQGWISGITVPRYASNVEGGGGKVLLMPSGHDTLNLNTRIENKISGSHAALTTWDHKEIIKYEALGRSTEKEFSDGVEIMDAFIGRKGIFLPRIIIVDEKGNHIRTTNSSKLPVYETRKKSEALGYELFTKDMPLTNPALIYKELYKEYMKSRDNV